MNAFEYASPTSLESALDLLSSRRGEAEVLAGGTDLVTALKQQIVAPKLVISLKSLPELRGIKVTGDQLEIGAMTTLAEAAEHDAVRKNFPALVQAIEGIGSPQIISAGTVAGDLCQRPRCWYYRAGFGLLGQHDGKPLVPEGDNRYHAIFGNQGPAYFVCPSSLAPALSALGATIVIAGSGGKTREVPSGEFHRAPRRADERENVLRPDEVVHSVVIPIRGLKNATYEVRMRSGLDWPLVAAAVAFKPRGAARVVLGHVAPTPWPAEKAAAVLEGQQINEELAAKAGEAAAEGASPLSRNGYKVALVKTAVKRAALAAAESKEG